MSECSLLRVVANIVSLTAPQHRHSRASGNLVSLLRNMLGRRFRGDDDISVHYFTLFIVDHALRTDPKGDIEIAKRFWRVETDEDKKGLAPLPLIYADLLATGDPRCIETAGLIRDRYLARFEQKT